jgi:hypothetical protein
MILSVLDNSVHIILSDLAEHLFGENPGLLGCRRVYLRPVNRPLYGVAYSKRGYHQPVIMLTDMRAENYDLALRTRNRYAKRWKYKTSVQFLKSKIGLERFAIRKYARVQCVIFLASLSRAFLVGGNLAPGAFVNSSVTSCVMTRSQRAFCFYQPIKALQKGYDSRAGLRLLAWCKPP